MNIGIDVRELKKDSFTGLGRVLEDLFSVPETYEGHNLVLFGDRSTDWSRVPANALKVTLKSGIGFVNDHICLPLEMINRGVDVFFSPYMKTPFYRACPYVNTVSDTIPLDFPRRAGFMSVLEKAHFLFSLCLFTRRTVKTVAISRESGKKASRVAGVGPERIKVIYPAVTIQENPAEGCERSAGCPDDRYILYAGNFKPHKNLNNLVRAYDLLPKEIKDSYSLLLAGGAGREIDCVKGTIYSLGLEDRVRVLPSVPDEALIGLYRGASCFVFPSVSEGFGLPPVEAMKLGVPVVSSCHEPMGEVLDAAALFFDPESPEDMARCVEEMLSDESLRMEYVKKGFDRASFFGADKMGMALVDVLENAGAEKVLCVSTDYPPVKGGIATYVYNIWSRMPVTDTAILSSASRWGSGVFDAGLDVQREKYPLGGGIVSRGLRTAALIWHVWRKNSLRKIRKNHCAQMLSAGLGGALVKLLRGTPFVVYAYSADILEFRKHFFTRWLLKFVIGASERVIACSLFAKALIVGRDLAPQEKVKVITPGVCAESLAPRFSPDEVKLMHGIPAGKKMLLSVSRLSQRKGLDKVIDIFPGILEEYEDIVYVIAGDGDRREYLEDLVRKRRLQGKVILTGGLSREELADMYNACDVFILLPRYMAESGDIEGFGIVFLEANACGKPVIAGNTGGVPEAVVDGVTGILVDPERPHEVENALLRLLRDEEYALRLGRQGRQRVERGFSWDSRAEQMTEFF